MDNSSKFWIKKIEANGWVFHSQRGSHAHFKHPIKKGKITIPHPRKELSKGVIHSIKKQAGI